MVTAATSRDQQRFLQLLRAEMQNRAFALVGIRLMLSQVSDPDDIAFYSAWVAFEEFNQRQYAPTATRYEIPQDPNWSARTRASLANTVAALLSETTVLKFMLKETRKYISKLEEMSRLAPSDDQSFLRYVVDQEKLQVDVLVARINGENQKAARLLEWFVAEHGGRENAASARAAR